AAREAQISAQHRGPSTERWRQPQRYDSLGRMGLNVEQDTSKSFTEDTTVTGTPSGGTSSGIRTWRYAYNDAGDLVGTSDARGCGENFRYDAQGRLVIEDYSPRNTLTRNRNYTACAP